MRDTYRDIERKLPQMQPIFGSRVHALRDGEDHYIIYSYDTLIARVNTKTERLEYF